MKRRVGSALLILGVIAGARIVHWPAWERAGGPDRFAPLLEAGD